MSIKQSKRYSHIWDNNNTGVVTRRNPYYLNSFIHDTTGSSITSTLEYSREEITVVSPRAATTTCCHHTLKSKQHRKSEKPVYVTNRERAVAEPPKQLATWTYQPVRKEKYDPLAIADAFEAYQHRLRAKKWAEPKVHHHVTHTHTKKRVSFNETDTEVVEDTCPKYQKVRITNRRNDEIKIDNCVIKTVEEEDDVIKCQKKTSPGFYGTIEAEQAAEAVAGHLSYACDHLERLRFVTDEVYPQATHHLKQLHDIEDDVKDFNMQMRHRRVKPPVMTGTHTQIAHFIINDNWLYFSLQIVEFFRKMNDLL